MKNRNKILLAFIIVLVVSIVAYLVFTLGLLRTGGSELAKGLCIQKCQEELSTGRDLSKGPCLSEEIIKNWVCDVAHSPREAVDNLKENQCSSYGVTANYFVEVDPNCKFIRAI